MASPACASHNLAGLLGSLLQTGHSAGVTPAYAATLTRLLQLLQPTAWPAQHATGSTAPTVATCEPSTLGLCSIARSSAQWPRLLSSTTWPTQCVRMRHRALHTRGMATSGRHHPPVTHASSSSSSSSSGGPLALYHQRLQQGVYKADPRQELTVSMLQELWDVLHSGVPRPRKPRGQPSSGLTMVDALGQQQQQLGGPASRPSHKHAGKQQGGRGWWAGVSSFLSGVAKDDEHELVDGASLHVGPHIQGLYMYGGVGCGKTMLMDLFVSVATPAMQVQRTHYHDFMLSVHEKLRTFKGDVDPLLRVADSIAKRARVLALDEFFVTDVADAMILARLFGRLWDRGCVLVATSNRTPDRLYEGGLQRVWFLPFIDRLKVECVCHDMASRVDYRRLSRHQHGAYFTSHNRDEELEEAFDDCSSNAPEEPVVLQVKMGRTMTVPRAAGGCALLSFGELCDRPLGAADYLAFAEHFHTLAISGVPVFTAYNRPAAYRFVTLLDILYEHRVRVLIAAESNPVELFENIITPSDALAHPELKVQPRVVVDDKLGFAKDRTISRLTEMQSQEYLAAWAERHGVTGDPALTNTVEVAVAATA